jgi:hypothetical protein
LDIINWDKTLNDLDKKFDLLKQNNSNIDLEEFIKIQILQEKTGLLFLKKFLVKKGFDSTSASKLISKYSVKIK